VHPPAPSVTRWVTDPTNKVSYRSHGADQTMRMRSKRPTTEESTERAVSPVIGVILMVAITVILAAVIAAFVLDIGPGEANPSASYTTSDVDGGVEVELNSLDGGTDGIVVLEDVTDESADQMDSDDVLTISGGTRDYTGDEYGDDSALIAYDNGGESVSDDTSLEDLDNYAIIDNLDEVEFSD